MVEHELVNRRASSRVAIHMPATVTIASTDFDCVIENLSLGGAQVTNPDRVDDQTIVIQVPQGAHTGDLTVTVDGIPSAPQHFRVWSSLAIATPLRYLPQGRAVPARTARDRDPRR